MQLQYTAKPHFILLKHTQVPYRSLILTGEDSLIGRGEHIVIDIQVQSED